jgi:hypothetical protein
MDETLQGLLSLDLDSRSQTGFMGLWNRWSQQ